MIWEDIIIRPIITEKTTLQKEKFNQISFEVNKRANRVEIKKAVEESLKINVESVNTVQVKGKVKRRGRIIGKRKDWKKAIVKLMPGERVEYLEGA